MKNKNHFTIFTFGIIHFTECRIYVEYSQFLDVVQRFINYEDKSENLYYTSTCNTESTQMTRQLYIITHMQRILYNLEL